MTLEFRNAVPIGGELKDLDEKKREVLVSFPHDVRDSFSTSFGVDCFRSSFEKRLPAVVWQHSLTEPIGRTISAQVTGSANELVSKFSDFDAVPLARRAFSQLEDGSLTDASFGFVRHTDEKHPEMRGVTRITSATMQEWSPVTIGAIPGAVVTGTRADELGVVLAPTAVEIESLFKRGLLERDEARAMLADLTQFRAHIILGGPAAAPVVEIAPEESRTEPAAEADELDAEAPDEAPESDDTDAEADADDTRTLVAHSVAAVREALGFLPGAKAEGLDNGLRQAVLLVEAGNATLTELLDVLGIEDNFGPEARTDSAATEVASDEADAAPEAREDPEAEVEERALTLSDKPWSQFSEADYTPAQYKAACLIWDGPADDKSSGILPVREPDGTVNKAGMIAAAGRLNQVKASDSDKKAAAKALMSLYGKAGLKPPPTLLQAARSVDDPETRAIVVEAVDSELDDLFGRLGGKAA